jgi:hypothetical protein
VNLADVPRVEQLILDTLLSAAREGFADTRLDGLLQQLEIRHKHVSAQFGMNVLQALITPLTHHTDPVALLQGSEYIARLRASLSSNPRLFQDLITDRLLNNGERVTLIMSPSEKFDDQLQAAETQRLADALATMGPAQLAAVRAQSAELARRQALPQDPSCLPTLSVAKDIPRVVRFRALVLARTRQALIFALCGRRRRSVGDSHARTAAAEKPCSLPGPDPDPGPRTCDGGRHRRGRCGGGWARARIRQRAAHQRPAVLAYNPNHTHPHLRCRAARVTPLCVSPSTREIGTITSEFTGITGNGN